MVEAKVNFTLDDTNLTIECSKEDKMEDICQKYATKKGKNLESLLFLQEGKQINLQLSFKDQVSALGNNNNEMNIFVYLIVNGKIVLSKYEKQNQLNKKKIEELIKYNKEINDIIEGINLKIGDIIEISRKNSKNVQIQDLEDIQNICQKIYLNNKSINLLSDENDNIYYNTNNNMMDNKINLNNKILIKDIKSETIIQKIFSFVDEKVKLKEIKYNKNLQNINGIKINDYKYFSGRYIVSDAGIVQEYLGKNDSLLFKGEYLNGKRWNGYTREYHDNGRLKFEGMHINGQINGIGKEYNIFGKLCFEGEYLNGKRHGKGREIGMFKFEGEYLNGKRNGKGKERDRQGVIIFEGEYLDGERWNGKGIEYNDIIGNNSEIVFEGEYLNGKRNGKGKEYNILGKLIFEGEYLNGKRWRGKRKEYYYDEILKFEGEYINGERYQKGREYSRDGSLLFEGEYFNGKEWNGHGAKYADNKTYVGGFLNGQRSGKGEIYDIEGDLIFEGEFLRNYKVKGKEYISNSYVDTCYYLEYEGEYLFNKRWNGKEYDKNGNIKCEIIKGKSDKIKE